MIGKVAIQPFPAALGALLARSQFTSDREEDDEIREETYGGELFIMAVGALFLGLKVAATEEVVLIPYRVTAWHALDLALLSLAIVHGFVFAVGFAAAAKSSRTRHVGALSCASHCPAKSSPSKSLSSLSIGCNSVSGGVVLHMRTSNELCPAA